MTRSCINICLIAVISLLFGVIWQGNAIAAAPTMTDLGQLSDNFIGAGSLDVDAAGDLYVADNFSRVIYKYNKYGNRIATFDVKSAAGYLVDTGLAVSNGQIFVTAAAAATDAFADRVLVLDASNGTQIGMLGAGAGEFNAASTLDVDANGNIYVIDLNAAQSGKVIKVYASDFTGGAQLGTMTFLGSASLSIDRSANRIYVANYYIDGTDTNQSAVNVYDTAGTQEQSISAVTGFNNDVINRFGDIAFDDANRFYVSDFSLNSIRVMDKPATEVLKYTTNIDQAPSMVYDALTKRLFVNHANGKIDIIGIDGGATPVQQNSAPTVPNPITMGEVSSASPALVFDNAVDADGDAITYTVEITDGVTPSTNFTIQPGATQSTAVALDTLTENQTYSWRVQASDGTLASAWSAAKTISINAVPEAPTAPSLTSFLSGETAGSTAALTWSAATDADPNSSLTYRVEITAGITQVASGNYAGTSAAISGLAANLDPGSTYTWKVVAVDNTARETVSSNTGNFVYQTSVLKVSANVAGATVSLGGHHGYAGRLIGTAPVEVRDLAEGSYAVVVEAAGFEPVVQTVVVNKDQTTDTAVELKGARLATSFAQHGLNLNGQAIAGAEAAITVDLNQDGYLDMLVADNGNLSLYVGSLAVDPQAADTIEDMSANTAGTDRLVFAALPLSLGLPQVAGAVPCVVDWNNDDKFDLLVGAADGSVKLFLSQGNLTFDAGTDLLYVVGQAVPVVADINADGLKDLLVAAGNDLYLYTTSGTDDAPVLGGQTTMLNNASPVAPVLVDWDADGVRDLLILSQGELFQTTLSSGAVTAMTTTGLSVTGATNAFALNFAGSNYTDLVFAGSSALTVANGQQGGFAPAYKTALLDKLAEVETQVLAQNPGLIGKVASISSRIGRGKYASALTNAQQLEILLGATTPAGLVTGELIGLLK